jgi:hypothetical protein
MEENLLDFILSELDGIRAGRNRALLNSLDDDYEPFQFFELEQFDVEKLFESEEEEEPPATRLLPFAVMGEENAEYREFGFGVWQMNLN